MTPRRYGPLAYVPIHRRLPLTWPDGARVALWVNPNVEFFGLDDVMPSNLNDRVPREQAQIPNVRNWAVRDYGNRVGIWRLMEVLTRYGIRASAALNSEVCDHHPEIIEEGGKLGWEWIGHNQTNALRLTEMDPEAERAAIRATIDRIEAASGTRPLGWLGAGLAETWNTLDYLTEAGIRYLHMIVPGGGISFDGTHWVRCRPGFLLPVRVLSRLFRRLFLAGLADAHAAGRLAFFGELDGLRHRQAFAAHLAPLKRKRWFVYAKPPFTTPEAVLAYLARYTHRVAISNSRLVGLDERGVTFRYKDYRRNGRERFRTMTLKPNEFIRRFLLHVLPKGSRQAI